MITMPAPTLQ